MRPPRCPSPLEGEVGSASALPGGGWPHALLHASIAAWHRRWHADSAQLRPMLKSGCGLACAESSLKGFASGASTRWALTSSTSSVRTRSWLSKSMADSMRRVQAMLLARAGSKHAAIVWSASGTTTCWPTLRVSCWRFLAGFAPDPPPARGLGPRASSPSRGCMDRGDSERVFGDMVDTSCRHLRSRFGGGRWPGWRSRLCRSVRSS